MQKTSSKKEKKFWARITSSEHKKKDKEDTDPDNKYHSDEDKK